MSRLVEPFEFEFFRLGLLAAASAGALLGLVGVYVVQRGMSYAGHGLAHATFGGAVVSYLLGVNLYLGAGVWGLVAMLAINQISRRRIIGADAAIGVVTTASFALGLALISRRSGFTRNFEATLFGNVLGVETGDVILIAGVLAGVSLAIVFAYRRLLFVAFDPEVAELSGVKVARMDALLALILAVSIMATMQLLGVTLIAAALVTPPVIARMLTASFARMLVLSTAVGTLIGIAGMLVSYHLDIASGPAIVLVGFSIFVVVLLGTALLGTTASLGITARTAAADDREVPSVDLEAVVTLQRSE